MALRFSDDEGEADQQVLNQAKEHCLPRSLGGMRPFRASEDIPGHSPAGRFICWRSTHGEHYPMRSLISQEKLR
jgi:hypothetical protein